MIEITSRWSVDRDRHQWTLTETYTGKDKDGVGKSLTRETYHPWLDMALRYAAEREGENSETLADVLENYCRVRDALSDRCRALERLIGVAA